MLGLMAAVANAFSSSWIVIGAGDWTPVVVAPSRYVDANRPDDSGDGLSWETAKKTIQAAIDVADKGAHIIVASGIYGPITSNNKAVTILSTDGVKVTIIDGGGTNRCATLDSLYTVTGFTLTNGYAPDGGGVYGGTLNNCILTGNTAEYGGGAYSSTLNNCILIGNTAGDAGGGANGCNLNNCTLSDNEAVYGGGVFACELGNSIVWGNTSGDGITENYGNCTFSYSCAIPLPEGDGNIGDDPLFVDAINGDFHLQRGSPCIDAGNKNFVTLTTDLDGTSRNQGGSVDMGAYEYFLPLFCIPDSTIVRPSLSTTYDGFLYDGNSTVRGTITLSMKMTKNVSKKPGINTINYKVSAKVLLKDATVRFSHKSTGYLLSDVTFNTTKKGESLTIDPYWNKFKGTFIDAAGNTFNVIGSANNTFAAKKTLPTDLCGLYNVALTDTELKGWTLGYVSLSVNKAGSAKLAGRLEDGTAISGSANLLAGLYYGDWLCVALHRPLYSKKGFIGGLLWLDPAERIIRTDKDHGWYVDWVRDADPKKPGVDFVREMEVLGGWFSTGKVAWFLPNVCLLGIEPQDILPAPANNLVSVLWTYSDYVPVSSAYTVDWKNYTYTNVTYTPSKPIPPVFRKDLDAYDYSDDNISCMKLSYTAKTGVFKGSFKMYCDSKDINGKRYHKAVNVPYTGVMIPIRDTPFATCAVGWGVGTATINKQKVPVGVWLWE